MPPTAAPTTIDLPMMPTIHGAPEGQDARLIAAQARDLARDDRIVIHIALDDNRVATMKELLAFFAPDVRVIEFPAWDCLPYDRVSPNGDIVAKRVAALTGLLAWQADKNRYPRVLLTTINAALQKVTPKAALDHAALSAKTGGRLKESELLSFLIGNGYARTDTVREPGEFAIRGGIIDLFPTGYENPIRIDLFGDEIESIRPFDPLSQMSEAAIDEFTLRPVTEFFLDEESVQRFRAAYRETFGAVREDDPLYEAVTQGRRYNGMDHWLPLFFDSLDTLFDYTGPAALIFDAHAAQARDERMTQTRDFYEARRTLEQAAGMQTKKKKTGGDVSLSGAVYHPLPPGALYIEDAPWADILSTHAVKTLSPFAAPENMPGVEEGGARKGRDFGDIRALPEGDVLGAARDHIVAIGKTRTVIIACYSEGSRDRLKTMLDHAGLKDIKNCDTMAQVDKLKSGQVGMALLALEHGFITDDFAVLSEQDILGDRLARRASKRKKADNFLTEVSALNEGDLVVHIDHGVGRFDGLETLHAAGRHHDCLKIIYDGGDKLFVPVENIEVLTRFGSDEGSTQLDKLGGAGWQARKARVKKDLMAMAEGLLKIAAARELHKAERLNVDKDLYNSFAARFPYQETEDQLRSIDAVVADLDNPRPMDRLVCGDVGFGKTEVALRAAYVAAMAGSQVAVAVPTTLLARQHYNNFVKRFEGTGLRVGQLSRMVSPKDAKITKQELAEGSVNIVIGTHALFSKDVKFAHLGLLIVDEEQRFGVKQKEKLKELKSDVHVLTLTATPIPRTLQMSLSGVKDMSLITTPPVDRLAIRSFVLPFDPLVIKEAILRERFRGGQTFYVCPRIADLKEVEDNLKELVPDVKIVTAHGQMSPTDLEDRMSAFYDGQYDILLTTQIIESGIDIPTANTMIIHRADMFGLAQLYQIRGRIGRSRVRAYAYLTYDPHKMLTPQALKRLEVIETLDTLGSGFQLASHDMDIRGAGNLLGEEQSGEIREVGVELYQQMLEEAVSIARAGGGVGNDLPLMEDAWSPQINMGTSVLIPENYVADLGVRMSLYRRLADLKDKADIDAFAAEMIDRFGKLPVEVENLLDIVAIKQLCRTAGIDKVEAGPKGAVLGFRKDTPPNVPGLMEWIAGYRGAIKLRPDQKIVVVRHWEETPARVQGVESLVRQLAKLAG